MDTAPKLGSFSLWKIRRKRSIFERLFEFHPLTFVLQVPHVQDGSQQLGDLPVLRVGEHEDLHGRADVGVLLAVIPAVAGCAVTLGRQGGHRVCGVKLNVSGTGGVTLSS